MIEILLYSSTQSNLSNILVWVLLSVLLFILVGMIFWQRRTGKDLADELAELDKVEKNNVQNEFVLKALGVATWHMDVATMNIVYDQDFRMRSDGWITDASDADGHFGKSLTMLQEQDAERIAKSMQALCEGKTDLYHEEYRVMIPGTNRFYWEESYATVAEHNVDGSPKVIVGTSKHIDDRKEMEDALKDARFKAEESDRLKTAFLANMSHEIRTPLNAIVGFTSVISDVQQEEERKQLLDLINENTQKLLRIVDDVVAISKIEAGQEEAVMLQFDLVQILNEVVGRFADKVKDGVSLTTSYASESQLVTTDLNRVQEIMRHLLSNAAKFTDRGSIVVGFGEPHDDRIKVWVRDTGKGIATEYQKRVFERFFKVDEFIPGAGLGLSTCSTMAYSIGGDVTVESKLGEGSTFTFEFPVGN
ncbi:MAG: HAMP domain-containing histidine kinase [Prevotella sp.]|nr:HAMP domain-containing histidine kinase [Prevotella sp.]